MISPDQGATIIALPVRETTLNDMQAEAGAMAGPMGCGELVAAAASAIVLGAGGRVGSAFATRLRRDGFLVLVDPADPAMIARTAAPTYLFDCAYRDGEAEAHVERIAGHLRHWRHYAGIFLPSSAWIDGDHAYARSKRVVEALADFYSGIGAHVVTDRIGYFPGDGIAADPTEPMIDQLVDGETLYRRVMARMLERVPG